MTEERKWSIIGSEVRKRCKIENGVLLVVECCEEEVVVPEGVTVIGAYAFANSAVRKVRLPLSVKKIEDKAFYCSALEEITLPRNVFCLGGEPCLRLLRIEGAQDRQPLGHLDARDSGPLL